MTRDYEKSSGNVFADLGFRNSKQELLKAKLTVEIYKLLKAQAVTQQEAAKLLGTTQAQVSALMRCKPVSVSVGRLMEFLTLLGQDVKVTVRPAPHRRKRGGMSAVVQPALKNTVLKPLRSRAALFRNPPPQIDAQRFDVMQRIRPRPDGGMRHQDD